jgi:hypothetical protein
MTLKPGADGELPVGGLWGNRPGKVNQRERPNTVREGLKLP